MPDDVATPKRMTPERRSEIESVLGRVREYFGGTDHSLGWVPAARELLAELRAVEAQLAEARRALEDVIVSESTHNKRHTPAMISRLALAKLAPNRSG